MKRQLKALAERDGVNVNGYIGNSTKSEIEYARDTVRKFTIISCV